MQGLEFGDTANAPGFLAPQSLHVAVEAQQPGVWWLRQPESGHCQSPGLPGLNIEMLCRSVSGTEMIQLSPWLMTTVKGWHTALAEFCCDNVHD